MWKVLRILAKELKKARQASLDFWREFLKHWRASKSPGKDKAQSWQQALNKAYNWMGTQRCHNQAPPFCALLQGGVAIPWFSCLSKTSCAVRHWGPRGWYSNVHFPSLTGADLCYTCFFWHPFLPGCWRMRIPCIWKGSSNMLTQ